MRDRLLQSKDIDKPKIDYTWEEVLTYEQEPTLMMRLFLTFFPWIEVLAPPHVDIKCDLTNDGHGVFIYKRIEDVTFLVKPKPYNHPWN
jgi:hypothetical protein